MATIHLRVSPGAKRDEIAGWRGDVLRVRVSAAPQRGKANEAVCALIATAIGVPARAVTVERGHNSRDKVLQVDGLSAPELERRLGRPLAGPG